MQDAGILDRHGELLGKVVVFDYPHTTDVRVTKKRWEHRRLKVHRVRDPLAVPLDPETLAIDPFTKRDGLLLTGIDLDTGRERSFWTGSMIDCSIATDDTSEARPAYLRSTFIVDRDDWQPSGPHDLPPNVERHLESSQEEAEWFAEGFNQAEMREPKGYWAVV